MVVVPAAVNRTAAVVWTDKALIKEFSVLMNLERSLQFLQNPVVSLASRTACITFLSGDPPDDLYLQLIANCDYLWRAFFSFGNKTCTVLPSVSDLRIRRFAVFVDIQQVLNVRGLRLIHFIIIMLH